LNQWRTWLAILADPTQAPTAIGAGIGTGGQLHLHPRDMIRDRATLGFVLLFDVRQLHPCRHRRCCDLAGLKCQLAETYRERVATLVRGLSETEGAEEALEAVRTLIDKIVLTPNDLPRAFSSTAD